MSDTDREKDDRIAEEIENRLRGITVTVTVAQQRIVAMMKQYQEMARAEKAQEALAEEEAPTQDGGSPGD